MRDGDRRPSLGSGVEGFLHDLLRVGVERRGRLVEQQDLGIPQKSTGNGNTLLLTTGQLGALAADLGVETTGTRRQYRAIVSTKQRNLLRKRLDEVEDVGVAASGFDLFLRDFFDGLRGTEQDVEADGTSVQSLEHKMSQRPLARHRE